MVKYVRYKKIKLRLFFAYANEYILQRVLIKMQNSFFINKDGIDRRSVKYIYIRNH